jgi:hypothetical protein
MNKTQKLKEKIKQLEISIESIKEVIQSRLKEIGKYQDKIKELSSKLKSIKSELNIKK